MLKATFILLISTGFIFAGGDSLKVMSYNIQGMKPGTEPEVRIINIIDKLIELDPDIIGLQEINESLTSGGTDNQAKVIADSLSSYFGIPYYYYYEFTHLSWSNQFREFVGIISKYPVVDTGYFQLATGVFPRKVVWNKINTPLGTVNVFNTHLSAFNLSQVRIQQVQQIISYVESIELNHSAVAAILTGDFNDPPNATSIQQLTNTGTDSFYVITYNYVNPSDPGYTVPSDLPTSKIDYIFIKNTGSIEPFESEVVMDQPYNPNKYCSDHLGVLTSFRAGIMSAEEESFIHPEEIELYQNFPNPFNPSTKIRFTIPSIGIRDGLSVQLKIYDVLGNEIETLIDEKIADGTYEVEFNAKNQLISSGVLFLQLRSGNIIKTKKMLLLN
jgi:endonuclease/exonuclease/phosphatase family metal-dependent hydrolase